MRYSPSSMKVHLILLVAIGLTALTVAENLKYPNEITETPAVLCEPDRIIIKVKTSAAAPSHIYAEDRYDDGDCSARNSNKVVLMHGTCGMLTERTEQPAGLVQRICISVQMHPLFVTEADRSYCAQCVYMESNVVEDLEQTLTISEAPQTDLDTAMDAMPKCSYSIRKESPNGPEARFATIGEPVFHVWQCDKESTGLLVQNCFVEDGNGNRIMIIDQNGCGVDHYVMPTPVYDDSLRMAYQETHVFKFAQKMVTRFTCQIRLCLRGAGCEGVTPPRQCPTLEQRLEAARQLRDFPLPRRHVLDSTADSIKKVDRRKPFFSSVTRDAASAAATSNPSPPPSSPTPPTVVSTTMPIMAPAPSTSSSSLYKSTQSSSDPSPPGASPPGWNASFFNPIVLGRGKNESIIVQDITGNDVDSASSEMNDDSSEESADSSHSSTTISAPFMTSNSTAKGSIYFGFGFDGKRARRAILVQSSAEDESRRRPAISMTHGYPQMAVVGELRVLDSADDVGFYERGGAIGDDISAASSPAASISSARSCPAPSSILPQPFLLLLLALVAIMAAALALALATRRGAHPGGGYQRTAYGTRDLGRQHCATIVKTPSSLSSASNGGGDDIHAGGRQQQQQQH